MLWVFCTAIMHKSHVSKTIVFLIKINNRDCHMYIIIQDLCCMILNITSKSWYILASAAVVVIEEVAAIYYMLVASH